jgi:hypothetical protein
MECHTTGAARRAPLAEDGDAAAVRVAAAGSDIQRLVQWVDVCMRGMWDSAAVVPQCSACILRQGDVRFLNGGML